MPNCIAATATLAVGGGLESREKDLIVAAEEPVTSPDQHAPTPVKAARIAGTVVIVMLLLMLFGNHEGNVESIWLIGTAGILAAIIIIDVVLRRNGLRD
ncbi:hypothetical protein GCM10028775_08850 [Catellatospora paridis]